MTFKVGQKIKCIDEGVAVDITVGNTYNVVVEGATAQTVWIKNDKGAVACYMAHRFESADIFNVGQKVVCVEKGINKNITVGKTYEVLKYNNFPGGDEIDIVDDVGNKNSYYVRRFGAVEPEVQAVPVTNELLTLTYAGVTINLDPSKPFSRKAAEAFIDVIYAQEE